MVEPKKRKEGERMIPQEWVGKRVEVDLVRPGPTLAGATYRGTLNAVTDLGIAASLSPEVLPETSPEAEEGLRERFYPWSAVLSIDLVSDPSRGVEDVLDPLP